MTARSNPGLKFDGATFREQLTRAKAESSLERTARLNAAGQDKPSALITLQKPWLPAHVRSAMRADFMRAHGLRAARRSQSPGVLRKQNDAPTTGPTFDHAELFTRDRKPKIYTSQPYGVVESVIERTCDQYKLIAFELGRERSWYYPFTTNMIVLIRAEDADEFLSIERNRVSRPWSVEPLSSIPATDKSPFREAAFFKKGRSK